MSFSLKQPPPSVYKSSRGGRSIDVPPFEPYQESLPLQSGYYSFAIDGGGDFRVLRRSTRSHSAMVPGRRAAAAGRIYVNRLGRVIEVVCQSSDFNFYFHGPENSQVRYIIDAFKNHAAFNLNESAIFKFFKSRYESWNVTPDARYVSDPLELLVKLGEEGAGGEISHGHTAPQVVAFGSYTPRRPPALHAIHRDQVITSLEDGDDESFEPGDPYSRLSLECVSVRSGKNNFIIDGDGWLILGMTGHQLLSGGRMVGGAGHIHIEPTGEVSRIEVNFSGHYRPTLSGDYARYVYQSIVGHPLLKLGGSCTYAGRIFKGCEAVSNALEFTKEELEAPEGSLDLWIESFF